MQGRPESMFFVALVLQAVLKPLVRTWRERKFLIEFPGGDGFDKVLTTALVWVDDVVIPATGREALEIMWGELDGRLRLVGWRLAQVRGKIAWTGILGTCAYPIQFGGLELESPGFVEILGAVVDAEVYSSNDMTAKIAQGWQLFYVYQEVLCDWTLDLRKRLQFLRATSVGLMISGGVTWTLGEVDLRHLDHAHIMMVVKMTTDSYQRNRNHNFVEAYKDRFRKARLLLASEGFEKASWLWAQAKWRYAGHVARNVGPDRLVQLRELVVWRSQAKLRRTSISCRPLHPRPGTQIKWETVLDDFVSHISKTGCGDDKNIVENIPYWYDLAQYRKWWIEQATPFCTYVCRNLGRPRQKVKALKWYD